MKKIYAFLFTLFSCFSQWAGDHDPILKNENDQDSFGEIGEQDFLQQLPLDVVIHFIVKFIGPYETSKCRLISNYWNDIMSCDDAWKVLYLKTWGSYEKYHEGSFLENFKELARPINLNFFLSFTRDIFGELRLKFESYKIFPRIGTTTISDAGPSYYTSQIIAYFDILLEETHTGVIKVITISFSGWNSFLSHFFEKFGEARGKDVLVILPGGNNGRTLSEEWGEINLHQDFPNVIWVGAHDEHGNILTWSNRGNLIEIFAPESYYLTGNNRGTGLSVLWIGEVAGIIRGLRPNLSAEEVRKIIIDSADNQDGINILNIENAINMALTYCRF